MYIYMLTAIPSLPSLFNVARTIMYIRDMWYPGVTPQIVMSAMTIQGVFNLTLCVAWFGIRKTLGIVRNVILTMGWMVGFVLSVGHTITLWMN